jgi:hypothetical protein
MFFTTGGSCREGTGVREESEGLKRARHVSACGKEPGLESVQRG